MTSTRQPTWPRQLRLPGQVAAPDGPIDMHLMYVMHHAFRRDLDLFAAAVKQTPAGERRTWQLLADRWELFAEVLHEHHTVEDEGVWPAVLATCSPADVATLEAMEAEHEEIDPLLESCAAGFRRLAERADEDARAALAVRVCAARESLRRHLAHEETDAIAIIQRVLTAEDWHRIEEEHANPKDRTLGKVVRIVPWAAHRMPREALDRVFAQPGGAGFQLIWRLTRRRYARREAAAFRFA
ncbi:hemerythrin domain-containing protein [Nocardioides mangrovi]|uniref:Hemerythrin domain-containing protein n=1 Tax=Nocardioides mangrovi TaxID=2874580 RepID=A0ABS7UDC6_9ACTN|nr:hemerythrin domain-containing protein [Nocardioides mangrovi]MBZ5738711.1 hemerythrin domain-containing protein [Nocardioides mangrovi]